MRPSFCSSPLIIPIGCVLWTKRVDDGRCASPFLMRVFPELSFSEAHTSIFFVAFLSPGRRSGCSAQLLTARAIRRRRKRALAARPSAERILAQVSE